MRAANARLPDFLLAVPNMGLGGLLKSFERQSAIRAPRGPRFLPQLTIVDTRIAGLDAAAHFVTLRRRNAFGISERLDATEAV